jgi:hypothetical protein
MQLPDKLVTNVFNYNKYNVSCDVMNLANTELEKTLSGEISMVSLRL